MTIVFQLLRHSRLLAQEFLLYQYSHSYRHLGMGACFHGNFLGGRGCGSLTHFA